MIKKMKKYKTFKRCYQISSYCNDGKIYIGEDNLEINFDYIYKFIINLTEFGHYINIGWKCCRSITLSDRYEPDYSGHYRIYEY